MIMKHQYIIGSIAAAFVLLTSCAVHDPFADKMEIGQVLPTVDWQQNSTVVKAGNYASFKGQYYTSSDREIDHSEVWGLIRREQSAAATSKLTTSLAYTKTYTINDTVRSAQSLATYPHSLAVWDGYEYTLNDSFPTSRTLAPVTWATPTTWDQDKFDSYYPSTFQQEFVDYLVNALTKDSLYYNDLRNVYINYDFTVEQFETLNAKYGFNIPTDTAADKKSDNWFAGDEIDHYYYTTVKDSASVIYHEIASEADAPEGVSVYPVYTSSEWLFSRYSDDTGGKITTVRSQYMPYWKELISSIPFTAWIYNTSDKNYTVNFTRQYYLMPSFRVYDTEGKVGISSNNKEVTLN